MNESFRVKYSKVYDALKNTKELIESLDGLNNEEAKVYINTFIAVTNELLENK